MLSVLEIEFDGKMLGNALHSNKQIKSNLCNYACGTSNSVGIMHHSYKLMTMINGMKQKLTVNCYMTFPPNAAEPPSPSSMSWWQTLPPTRTRESNRNKCAHLPQDEGNDDESESKSESENNTNQPMQVDFDPWNDTKIQQLFLPGDASAHPKEDAIAQRIDILMEAHTEPDGYKRIISGGDPFNNCTEVDKIKILDQCMYLICALSIALTNYPMTTWRKCCEDASKTCSIVTKSYAGKTIDKW